MLKADKDIFLFSLGTGFAVFAAFSIPKLYISGAIFGFLSAFLTAFILLIHDHRRQKLENSARAVVHNETVIFSSPGDIYTGSITAKGCVVLTLSNFYFIGIKKDKTFGIVAAIPYKSVSACNYGSIISISDSSCTYEIKCMDKNGLSRTLREKIK